MTRILYLVHDLADPAVQKRVAMLQAGGADVRVAGFRRGEKAITSVSGVTPTDLGQTFNGGFAQRILAVLKLVAGIKKQAALFENVDVIIARNLELLAIGVRGRAALNPTATLFYESLDIHRLMLRGDIVGKGLRALEGWLSKRAAALLTSSPAFVAHYFKPLSAVQLPTILVENKVFAHEAAVPNISLPRADGPPWRIGWFGAIRCRKSLALLRELATRMDGKVEIIIRGKPAYDVFDDFDRDVTNTPHLRFMGPYKNP